MELKYLANFEGAIPTVAKWYHDEWGYLMPDYSITDIQNKLQKYLNTDKAPLMVIAIDKDSGDSVIGVAQLKFREMGIFPEKEHWLGGVYVSEANRGKGLASKIIEEIVQISKKFEIEELFLQTLRHDGGLYKKLGWQPEQIVNYKNEEVLVMVNKLVA